MPALNDLLNAVGYQKAKAALSNLLTPRPVNLGTPGKRPLNVGAAEGVKAPRDLLEKAQLAYQGSVPDWLQSSLANAQTVGKALGLDQPASAMGGPGSSMAASALLAGAPGMVSKAAKAGEAVMDLSRLGRVVPMEEFRSGWIKPNGELIQLPSNANTHALSVARALKAQPQVGTLELPAQAAKEGLVRAFTPGPHGGNLGDLGAEMFSAPSDEQIRTLRQLERHHDMTLSYDLSHPETGTTMGTGMGVNRIRGAIRDAELQHGGLWTGEDIPAKGAEVTMPAKTYAEAATEKPINAATPASAGGNNIWVRQHDLPSNKNRTLMLQFSNKLINPSSGTPTTAEQYFDKLYNSRVGYSRPDDFWEIPQWQANLSHNMKDVDSYVVRDPAEAVQFLKSAGYGDVTASALDVNRDMIHNLAEQVPGQKFSVGGYTDMAHFNDLPNVKTYDSMPAYLQEHGIKNPKEGADYRLFSDTPTVPRLTMSTGCLHACAFCSMPRKVVPTSDAAVMQQADAIAKDLPSKLIYLNDKTFGQAPNYTLLPKVFQKIKAKNPDFQGFIIQTTAAQMKKMDPKFLQDAGIKQVELGLESYNDPILKAMHKPANQQLIDEAATKLRDSKIDLIPNLMVGLPGETADTYANTMNWLNKNNDIISHVNVNNLSVYKDAELANQLKPLNAADLDQNVVERSWHEDPAIHTGFYNDAAKFGSGQLDKVPFQDVTPKPAFQSAVATPPAPVPVKPLRSAAVGTLQPLPNWSPSPPATVQVLPDYSGRPVDMQDLLNPPRPGGQQ